MSQTPRTDAQAHHLYVNHEQGSEVVSAELCRELELELKAIRMTLKSAEMRHAADSEIWENEGCRLKAEVIRLRGVLSWIAGQQHLFFAECSQAEEIISKVREALQQPIQDRDLPPEPNEPQP